MKDIKVIEHTEKLGSYTMPNGAEELLKGKTIEEQMKFFAIKQYSTSHLCFDNTLTNSSDVKGLIVKDGIIVGVMVNDWACSDVPCYVNQCVCTWDASDNNGAGYKTREDNVKLVFLAEKEKQNKLKLKGGKFFHLFYLSL